MDVKLAYGRKGLTVSLPDGNLERIVHMNPVEPVPDPASALMESFVKPIQSPSLSELARGRSSAVIVISDITRPVPNEMILTPMLNILEEAGIPRGKITILIATGIHRPNLGEELVQLVGPVIARNYRIVNHDADDLDSHRLIDTIEGNIPVYVDRHFLDADLKILTGLVELHLMAGFSGGRKAVLPGIASLETMKHMHGYRMIQRDEVCNGRLGGNPFHEAAVRVARKAGAEFIANVTLDEQRRITGVFSGDLEAAHAKACEYVRGYAQVSVNEPADIVVTTGGGYPLDKTLYQAIKGFVGALEVVKPGGTVILAAENDEGAGSPPFIDLLRRLQNPMDFYKLTAEPNYIAKDQWMIQELVNGLHRCELLYYTEGITPDDLRDFLIVPVDSVEDGVARALKRHGPDARILAIPEGPYVIPKTGQPADGLYSWQTAMAE